MSEDIGKKKKRTAQVEKETKRLKEAPGISNTGTSTAFEDAVELKAVEVEVTATSGKKKASVAAGGGGVSVLDKVVAAIRLLKSPTGSSSQAIAKVCKAEFSYENETFLKKALKTGVASGVLLQNKASFLVKLDPVYADTRDVVSFDDVSVGSSAAKAVSDGDVVTIKYIGTLDDQKGHKFDSGSLTFTVGEKEVVKGMDQGVLGMRVGGRRILTIPPSLGYGKKGSGPDIPPSSILCFDVTLKDLK